jgi:hypothetical protein
MKDYKMKIIIVDFPRTRSEIRKIISYLRKIANEFEKEKDLNIFAKNFTAKLMK